MQNIMESFEKRLCDVCHSKDLSQFFRISDNFVSFEGVFHSFREILIELQIIIQDREDVIDICCLDCKEKVLKFYLFKRRVKEKQKELTENSSNKSESTKDINSDRANRKQNKVLHNIDQIIENYSEKCSITAIRVDERSKNLIIESRERPCTSSINKSTCENPSSRKQEDHESQINDRMEFYSNRSKQDSMDREQVLDQSEHEQSNCDKWQRYQEKRRKRMEILRLPNNQDLYEKHKAQARERTRRYREKMRQKKSQQQVNPTQASIENFPFYQFAEVKLEEISDDGTTQT